MTKKKSIEFRGKIISSDYDFQAVASDVIGPHQVWYPKSRADVERAIKLSQNEKVFIRSGIQVTKQDIVDGTGGIVINLKDLINVTVEGNEVKAEAAVTTEMITEHLVEHSLVLPLNDNPLKSIVSNLLNDGPSYLMRSLGSLSSYVTKIRAVKPNGKPAIFRGQGGTSCLERCQASKAIITQVEFKAAPAKGLWMFRKTCPYPGRERFLKIARALFLKADLSDHTDLALDAYTGQYEVPFIRITALGVSGTYKSKLMQIVEDALSEVQKDFEKDIIDENYSNSDVLDAILDSGLGAAIDPTIDSERLRSVVGADENLDDFLIKYAEDVHQGIAFYDDDQGKLNEDLFLFSRLQVNINNGLEVTGYAYTPNLAVEFALPSSVRSKSSDDTAVPLPEQVTDPSPIPNFRGDVYREKDRRYKSHIKQYATSSYAESKMTPFMIAYPRDKEDISAAIAYAKTQNKWIVARSGGHQYSGKSSGGQDTIVLSMDAFNHLDISDNIVDVGPAVSLTLLAKRFKRHHITVPHGECPYVAIGGHTQTGGYGHLLRSFGLILDFVQAFDIVLANGRQLTVTRPLPGVSPTTADQRLNNQLFWGVLSGNAGSFGIVTNYKFEAIKDCQYQNSYGFSTTRKYREELFLSLMKETQKWTKQVESGTLPPEMDFMMTVASAGGIKPFPLLLAELVHSDLKNGAGNQAFHSIKKIASANASWWEQHQTHHGKQRLSKLSDSFVRRWPATTMDGREFKHPYKKRVNCTMKALTDAFVEKLVEMISHVVINVPNVKLVFQMSIGGGNYQKNKQSDIASISHRDYVYCFVFDLFYKKGFETTAIKLQEDMQLLIDNHFNNGQERRVFWGSFGDTDISKPTIRQMYYDSEDQYKQLQELKQEVDAEDVFHTDLTVQLPSQA